MQPPAATEPSHSGISVTNHACSHDSSPGEKRSDSEHLRRRCVVGRASRPLEIPEAGRCFVASGTCPRAPVAAMRHASDGRMDEHASKLAAQPPVTKLSPCACLQTCVPYSICFWGACTDRVLADGTSTCRRCFICLVLLGVTCRLDRPQYRVLFFTRRPEHSFLRCVLKLREGADAAATAEAAETGAVFPSICFSSKI